MRLLVTRADADAGPTIDRLARRGHDILHDALLKIEPAPDAKLPAADFLDGAQALIATSANGVRAISLWHQAKGMPFYVVGSGTADAARKLGFTKIIAAGGDVHKLAALVAGKCLPNAGPVLHVAGKQRAGDLKAMLEAKGFTVRRAVMYHARAATDLSDETITAITDGTLDGVLLFSPRTAQLFAELLTKAGLANKVSELTVFALSQNVADKLQSLRLKTIKIADAPTLDDLLALVPNQSDKIIHYTPPRGTEAEAISMPEPTPEQAPQKNQAKKTPAKTPAPKTSANKAPNSTGSSKTGWYAAGILALLIGGGAATIAAVPYMPDGLKQQLGLAGNGQDEAISARIGALEQSLARLQSSQHSKADQSRVDQSLAALRAQIDAREAISADPAPDTQTTDALAAQITALEAALADVQSVQQALLEQAAMPRTAQLDDATKARLANYDAQLAALSQKAEQAIANSADAMAKSGTANARLLAFAAVERAAGAGNSFATEWAVVAPLLVGMDENDKVQMAALAQSGVMSRHDLSNQFNMLIGPALRSAAMPAEANWWQKLWAQLTGIVSVRRTGAIEGDGPEARLARAEVALHENDMAKAMDELSGLQGPAAQTIASWLADAQQRLWLDQQLHHIRLSLLPVEG